MSDHDKQDNLLVAYVDGELDAAAARDVERMLAADPAMRADAEMFRSTAMLLRAACGEAHYPGPQRQAAPAIPSAQAGRRRMVGALAAGVALAVSGVGGGVLWQRRGDDQDFLSDIAGYHRTLVQDTSHLVEMGSDRGPEFAAWMSDRLGRHLAAPDLLPVGLHYAGGRMLLIDSGPVADFLYTRQHGEPVGLCALRAAGGRTPVRIVMRNGLRLASWSETGVTYVVVGDLDPDTARRIAETARDQLRV